jgi:hypothetical protein
MTPDMTVSRISSRINCHGCQCEARRNQWSFSGTLENAQLKIDFRSAIRGGGAFRSFKRLLDEYALCDAWNRFKHLELPQMAIEWCEENGMGVRQT